MENQNVENHMNQGKAKINDVVETKNFCKMMQLLYQEEKVTNIDHKFNDQTPLNYLAKALDNLNFDEVSEIMKLLIHHDASVKIPDGDNFVPLSNVLQKGNNDYTEKYELVYTLLLEYTEKDDVAMEAWRYIEDYHMKRHSEVLKRGPLDKIIARKRASVCVVSEDRGFCYKKKIAYIMHLLKTEENSALKMVSQTFNINLKGENEVIISQSMFFLKCKYFENLLSDFKLNADQARTIIIKAINNMPSMTSDPKFSNYEECFKILLENQNVDVSAADPKGIPLLSCALKSNAAKKGNDSAVRELLRSGAYIGRRSDYAESPLDHMRANILEEHLNECITIENGNICLHLNNVYHLPNQDKFSYNDLRAITFMRRTKPLQHLLQHPVINSLLRFKWLQYSQYYYAHVVLYFIFQLLIITHISDRFPVQTSDPGLLITMPLWLFIVYLLIRESVCIYLSWQHYWKDFGNSLLDVSIIVLSVLTSLQLFSKDFESKIAVCVLLSTLFKFLVLLSMMPFTCISMPILMLFKIAKTVIKNSIILAYLVFGFSLCFMIRFSETDSAESVNKTVDTKLSFQNWYSSFTKTLFMSTGEYDHGNIETKSWFDYILLLLFVIFLGVSFLNYLIGVAVSDIQKIQDKAEINKFSRQINFLAVCDVFIHDSLWNHWIFDKLKPKITPEYNSVLKITVPQNEYPYKMTLLWPKNTQRNKGQSDCTINHMESSKTDTKETNAMLPPKQQNVNTFSTDPNFVSTGKKLLDLLESKKYGVDDEFVNRALSIVKSNQNEMGQPELENRLKTIENEVGQISLQNQKIWECLEVIKKHLSSEQLSSNAKNKT